MTFSSFNFKNRICAQIEMTTFSVRTDWRFLSQQKEKKNNKNNQKSDLRHRNVVMISSVLQEPRLFLQTLV